MIHTFLDLPHEYDNMINQLVKKARVFARLLFLIRAMFEMSSRLTNTGTMPMADVCLPSP